MIGEYLSRFTAGLAVRFAAKAPAFKEPNPCRVHQETPCLVLVPGLPGLRKSSQSGVRPVVAESPLPTNFASTHEKARAQATRATGLRTTPQKRKKTKRVCAKPLPPLPGALSALSVCCRPPRPQARVAVGSGFGERRCPHAAAADAP